MKKVLIITYYWPPSGGIGVHRCLKIAKYLRDFGWEPVVYTAKNAQYPYFDEDNYKDIPIGLEVIRHKIFEPFNLFKILSGRKLSEPMSNPVHVRDKKTSFIDKFSIWIRGNFFIPDARALWIRPSVRHLSKYLKTHKVDAILSDGPPHTNTYIACLLSRKFNLPWLADFQDPWTQVDYYKDLKLTRAADRKHKRMEQEVFSQASKITIASPNWARELESIGADKVDEVYWGYDEDDFTGLTQNNYKKFTISHAGLLGYDRRPETLVKVLSEIAKEDPGFKENLSIRLAGMVDYSNIELFKSSYISENLVLEGNVSRKEALEMSLSSDVLLLPLNKASNAMGRIPGKLFEYLRTGVSILCLGPAGSDSGKIVESVKRGKQIEYDNFIELKEFILGEYTKFKSGKKKSADHSAIEKYSVKVQTAKIAGYLDQII